MKKNILNVAVAVAVLGAATFTGCKKNENDGFSVSGPDQWDRKFITLTGAFPDNTGEAGNGGTMAYAITLEEAANPNFEVNVFANGYSLRSQRTARVQSSANGNFLYNIQYTGTDGGIFNKYKVAGKKDFVDTREEVDTEPILGASPRWVVAAEGIGIGVYAAATVQGSAAEGAGATFIDVKSTAKIAVLNLNDPKISRQTEFTIPLTAAQTKAGYQIGRIDVPILNREKTKIFIGCNLTRVDVNKVSTVNTSGAQTWPTTNTREFGTATLVVDYPSLTNPRLIYSDNSKVNNHSYRTMTQYVGTDGHIYQATATSGSQILRIDATTNTYDNTYVYDLKTALGTSNTIAIKAWKYIKDGVGLALYTETNVTGGQLALIDLTAKTATKLAIEGQSDAGFATTLGQFQHIGLGGDYAYVPVTPSGADGTLYLVNWKTKTIAKGAKLKNQSGSFYLGAY